MSEWAGVFTGTRYDELIGGTYAALVTKNIEVEGAVERGELLSGSGGKYKAAAASDVDKELVIAKEDFEPEEGRSITQGYSSGVFNREKVKAGEGVIESLEVEMRRQQLYLTSIEKNYNNN